MFETQILIEALPSLMNAGVVTLQLTAIAALLSLLVGTCSCMLQLSSVPGGYWVSRIYVSLMRGTPLVVQLFVVFFTLPLMGIKGQAFMAAAIAIGLNSGAYTTEILRAAVQNVPAGHIEAAETIGMSRFNIWRRIILPQAFAQSLPALTNEFTIVLKSTPLASIIAVTELTYAGVLIQARTFSSLEVLIPVAVIYILIAVSFMRLSRWLERRFAIYHA
ncbi:MAG: polar amino acid transport system permease protein [Oleiphilaceae bacterium]|jgi:polar amino acid transport system permease protein